MHKLSLDKTQVGYQNKKSPSKNGEALKFENLMQLVVLWIFTFVYTSAEFFGGNIMAIFYISDVTEIGITIVAFNPQCLQRCFIFVKVFHYILLLIIIFKSLETISRLVDY